MKLLRTRPAGHSLLIVDLESRGGARPALEWRAQRMAARLGARARGGDRPHVLLHLPDGFGPKPGWPAGVRVIPTWERLSPSRLRDIYERVFAQSFEMLRGPIGKLFPHVCGVNLGELNLVVIQAYLASFAVISAALGDLLDAGGLGDCHIVTADVGFARALERQVAGRAKCVSTWPPWRLLEAARRVKSTLSALRPRDYRKAEKAARDAMASRLREQRLVGARARVLAVSSTPTMVRMFGVVGDALTEAGVGPVVGLDFSGACAETAGAGALVCRCGASGSLGVRGGLLRARWGDARRELQSNVALAALEGSPDASLVEGILGYLYVSTLDAQARHLWAAVTAVELLQPEVVLVGNDRGWGGQAFVHAARRRGIPSVCVQDGAVGDDPSWWWMTADRLAAMSESLVHMLVRHGVAAERCTVTGQPRYDFVTRLGPDDQRVAQIALGLDPSRFSVLFAVHSNHAPDYARATVAALLAVPGVHVMLRPHPSDRRDLCERLMREHESEHMTLHLAGDSLTLVRACDVLVTRNSTVILEAALLGKPVISADFSGRDGDDVFVAAGIATPVRGLEELTQEVQRLTNAVHTHRSKASRSGHAGLTTLLGPADGRAGERVAKLVAEVLERAPGAVPAERIARCRDGGVTA